MTLSNPIIPSLEIPDKISVQTVPKVTRVIRHVDFRLQLLRTSYFEVQIIVFRRWDAREEVDQRPHRSSNDKWPAITPISWSPRGSYASESGAQKINYHQPARCCNCRFSSVACTSATQPRGVPRSPSWPCWGEIYHPVEATPRLIRLRDAAPSYADE